MALKGVEVKQLASYPFLLEIDEFYLDMYQTCKNDFKSILEYCKLYGLTEDEILFSVSIVNKIFTLVN